MKIPQCIHCKADIDVKTGECTAMCLCQHYYDSYGTFTSFTCKICGHTVDMEMWRAANFERYLQSYIITK